MDKNNFVASRLAEARESRGLKQVALSQLLGITRQAVSAYEKGTSRPTVEMLEKISNALNFPISFFLVERSSVNGSTIFFRSLASATKIERQISAHRMQWVEDFVEYIERYVDLMPVRIPNYDLGKTPGIVPDSEIESIALQVRKDFGLGLGPISNIAQLLENNGAILSLQELPSASLDAFSRFTLNGKPIVVYGVNKKSCVRSRFDLSHELGHFILHRSILSRPLENEMLKVIEHQAHRFASCFLMPEKSFTADLSYPSINNFRLLKGKWLVSIAAMIKRCHDLHIIDDRKNTYFNIQKSKLGWTTREPLDDTLAIEKPVLLSRAVELLISEQVRSKQDILNDFPLFKSDIIQITGLDPTFFTKNDDALKLKIFDSKVIPLHG